MAYNHHVVEDRATITPSVCAVEEALFPNVAYNHHVVEDRATMPPFVIVVMDEFVK